jgi:rhodanese-related sulfurtransferase
MFMCLCLYLGVLSAAFSQSTSPRAAQTAERSRTGAADIFHATLGEQGKTPEVSTAEFQQILINKSATVLDTRPAQEYAISHIPGALNVSAKTGVPISQYVSDVAEIGRLVKGKDAALILYCNGPFCGKSKRLTDELLAAGYTNIRRYQLGIPVSQRFLFSRRLAPTTVTKLGIACLPRSSS